MVTTQNTERPYCTPTAGPTSHSPPPVEATSRITPGPMTRKRLPPENGGGSGKSSCPQRGRLPWSTPAAGAEESGSSSLVMGTPVNQRCVRFDKQPNRRSIGNAKRA